MLTDDTAKKEESESEDDSLVIILASWMHMIYNMNLLRFSGFTIQGLGFRVESFRVTVLEWRRHREAASRGVCVDEPL